MTLQPPALELKGIAKSYGDVAALRPTDLMVREGELVTLLGPSGSGKSTILSLVAGITPPDQGRICFRGKDVTDLPAHRRDVGMVFQRYTLFPDRTVEQNIAFPLEVRRRPAAEVRERVLAFLSLMGLQQEADRYPSQISGGQAQRVALARALVFGPALMLMDEPLGALDRSLRLALQSEIRSIQQETHVPTLYVTHDQEEAMNLSDRIVVLREGRVVVEGTPRELYETPPSLWVARFLGDANVDPVVTWERRDGIAATVATAAGLRVHARVAPGVGPGGPAVVVIRPEDCVITAQVAPGMQSHEGRIVGVTYLGAMQRLEIRLSGGLQLTASVPGRAMRPAVGDVVYCGWPDDAPLIVPQS